MVRRHCGSNAGGAGGGLAPCRDRLMGGTGVDGPAGVMTWAMCLVLDVLSMSFPSCLAFVIATLSRSPGQELLEEFRHEHHGCDVSSRDQTSTSLCLTPTFRIQWLLAC